MRKSWRHSLMVVPLAAALVLTACSSDDAADTTVAVVETTAAAAETTAAAAETTAAPDTTVAADTVAAETTAAAPAAADVSLVDVCPATVSIQTDWNPEAEHGFLYQMFGPSPEINADKKSVTGTLVASGGVDTGVKIEVRSGYLLLPFI